MAVGFFPEEDERFIAIGSIRTSMAGTANSATQTPLQSPVSREFLVQAFCEAINRCSIAGEYRFLWSTIIYGIRRIQKYIQRSTDAVPPEK